VHPLLASTQQEYVAYETQAIGRIRRFGQKKTVHCWRFLAEDTIDTEIYAQRRRPSQDHLQTMTIALQKSTTISVKPILFTIYNMSENSACIDR
jgi:hypothetical protein